MTLGEKLKQARKAAGLSQKAVCGNTITRNMLSQIENGSANPSMSTLQYLAAQLGKPVGYFLGEEPQAPTPLLAAVSELERARHCIQAGKMREANQLLQALDPHVLPDWIRRQYLLLQAHFGRADTALLPSLDAELLLRAQAASDRGEDPLPYLRCCEQPTAQWQLLMGKALLQAKNYTHAAECLYQAEAQFPHQAAAALEICYRELQNYEKAYFYACKLRSLNGR